MIARRVPPWLWIVVAVGAFILVAPTVILIPMSFSDTRTLVFPPTGFSLRWYENFFTDRQWSAALGSSLLIGFLTSAFSVVIGFPVAMALTRSRSRLLGVLNALVLGPAIVPGVILGIGLYVTFAPLGLSRTVPGLVLAHTVLAIPLVVITLMASVQGLDVNVERAAANLGANPLRVFQHAILPRVAPGLAVSALYGFITSWDEMIVSLFLTGPRLSTLPVYMWGQVRNESDPTTVAVSSLLVVLSTSAILITFLVITARARAGRKTAHDIS